MLGEILDKGIHWRNFQYVDAHCHGVELLYLGWRVENKKMSSKMKTRNQNEKQEFEGEIYLNMYNKVGRKCRPNTFQQFYIRGKDLKLTPKFSELACPIWKLYY